MGCVSHVAKASDRALLIEKALSIPQCKGIDIVVCNAAVSPSPAPLTETSSEMWEKLFDINVKSGILNLLIYFFVTYHFHMISCSIYWGSLKTYE